jgi:Leucine-rich repeat (LRR) protein
MKEIQTHFLDHYKEELSKFSIDFSVFQSFDPEIDAILGSDQYLLQEGKGGVELYKPEADFIGLISKIGGRALNLSQNPRFFLEENAYYVEGGHVKRLSLFKRGLQALPDSIGNLTALENLVLSRNNLAFLPDRIGDLESLKELIVDNNQIATLSINLGNLASLEFLNFMWNRLTELPEIFTTMKNLKMLLLGWNRIQKLPTSFHTLRGLEHLDLSYNRLSSFPNLPNFDQLVYLNLEGNIMSSLDFNIDLVKLPNLMVLNLKGNRLFEVPPAICEMETLEVLNLEGNRISRLPENMCHLDRLKELSIQNNPISEISGTMKRWIHELEDRGVKVYREGLERF